jgi:hypothetical protein
MVTTFTSASRAVFFALLTGIAWTAIDGCGGGNGSVSDDSTELGSVQMELKTVPTGLRCVQIVATGSRVLVTNFAVSGGGATTFTMPGISPGSVVFTGAGFTAACSGVTDKSVPTWVADPVTVTISPGAQSSVNLNMRVAGSASVSVDFQCLPNTADCDGNGANGCETSTTTVTNCSGCGIVCDSSHSSGASCNGTKCLYTSCAAGFGDCSTSGTDADGCETPLNTTSNCGACGSVCDTSHSNGASCSGTKCSYASCVAGFVDCNLASGTDSDGCECEGSACCGGACQAKHVNCGDANGAYVAACGPLGQTFFDCSPLHTFTSVEATAAANASPVGGSVSTSMCGTANVVIDQGVTSCAMWATSGTAAGHVNYSATPSCNCPTVSDPNWQ